MYRLWPRGPPSSALPINPLCSIINAEERRNKRVDCTAERDLSRREQKDVGRCQKGGFHASVSSGDPVQSEGTHASAEGDPLQRLVSLGERQRRFLSTDAPAVQFCLRTKEVKNSPSMRTSWRSCHRSRNSGGGTGSEGTRTLPADTLNDSNKQQIRAFTPNSTDILYLLGGFP